MRYYLASDGIGGFYIMDQRENRAVAHARNTEDAELVRDALNGFGSRDDEVGLTRK